MQNNYMPLANYDVNEKNNSDLSNDELDSLAIEQDEKKDAKMQALKQAKGEAIDFVHIAEPKEQIVKTTLENVKILLDSMNIKPKYNEQSRETVLLKDSAIVEFNKIEFIKIKSACNKNNMSTGDLDGFIDTIAYENKFHPVRDWINSKPWDGEARLEDFFNTVSTANKELRDILMLKWMISAYAALVVPDGVEAHGVLVFQGGQGIGKTRWFNSLVPPELKATRAGVILNPSDIDTVHPALQNWLVELGELDATFRKSDIAQLKAFITNHRDVYRLKYDRRPMAYARRTVFFSSVNDYKFLHDTTGNRRFWVIPADAIDYRHKFDMQQVWAEVQFWYDARKPWWLSANESQLLNEQLQGHTQICPIEESINTVFEWDREPVMWFTATQVAEKVGVKDTAKGSREVNRCASILRNKNVITRTSRGRNQFHLPPFRSDF